jgi:outer membrane PBP1 activator LpoA protein
MAPICRRPRPALCVTLGFALILAACSLMRTEVPAGRQERAQQLAAAGKHADAARAYAELAAQDTPDRDNYELLSAEQWVAAGDLAAAKQALAAVSPAARTKLPESRALVAAEIALAENDPAQAIHELDSISVPTAPELAQNYWWIRGKSAFLTGHPVEGTRAFVERERWLTDPAGLQASRQELFESLRSAAERGVSLTPPPKTDPIVAGWLQLGPVAVEMQRNPLHAAAALANWRRLYPDHPANQSVLALAQSQISVATQYPDQIALLLPLSGSSQSVGVAVRDGFIAAYLEQDPATRPHIKIYDTSAEPIGSAYERAVQDGAGFIVGPLTKEQVAAIAPLAAGRIPVLALNFLSDSAKAPQNFYQFALLPEDEARIVARRVVADGNRNGVAIVVEGERGNRIAAAFADELSRQGGSLLDSQRFAAGQNDFSDAIRQAMQIHSVKGEPSTHRTDAGFIFLVAGTAATARLIVPQLKFQYAGDVPVYSTSDAFEPNSTANSDLDGLFFPDMPWMISADPVTGQIRDSIRSTWLAGTARLDRLYAYGFDAYRLVPALRSKTLSDASPISGVTGKLRLDAEGRIRRDLDWAQIKNGQPVEL